MRSMDKIWQIKQRAIQANSDCKNDEFFCSSNRKCISKMQLCDGERQCPGGEDEELDTCDALGLCAFKCEGYYGKAMCVRERWLCDDTPDCLNKEDESIAVCEQHRRCVV